MELNVSSQKPDLLSSDHIDDPEEREISEGDDEDDDRNHKHRRREENSQSRALDDGLPRTFRKRNRPFENGYSFREGDPQSRFALKNNNANPERDFSLRHEKRRPNHGNQRMRGNQMPGEAGPFRGRGRETVSFGIFGGMGLPNVSKSPNIPWSGFGMFPGMQNGVVDAVHHPLALPGGLGPAITPPMNIRMPRQRCPDFEERGFCLRGDMCPMEHGLNRIVVEDVQSLSQFNLPASLSGSQLLGPSGQGVLPVTSGASVPLASDVYDPDQPLWNNDNPTPSAPFMGHSNVNRNPSKRRNFESTGGFSDEHPLKLTSTSGSQKGRVGNAKLGIDVKDTLNTERGKKEDALNTDVTDFPLQGKWTNAAGNGPPFTVRSVREQSQKALRTLFVSGIPTKDNRKEALLSHFRKFGEVMNIHIPVQSERAFVQFSKREAAEAALKAPDAVMGNRFIKLFWANRDNIADDVMSGSSNMPLTPHGVTQPSGVDKGKENPKPVVASGPSPLQQKKLENLETLKEELRKKQEMLEQKRIEFQQQLDKLQKQAVVSNDAAFPRSPKIPKVETPPPHVKPKTAEISHKDLTNTTSTSSTGQKVVPPNTIVTSQEPSRPIRPLASTRAPIPVNRFKLDNRPTSFKVIPPLPAGLANVAALKEHFSSFGDLSSVELVEEEPEPRDHSNNAVQSRVSARIHFSTRHSAEKAFLHGKSFEGHKMNFKWLTSAGKELSNGSSVAPKATQSTIGHQSERGEPENLVKEREAEESIEQCTDSSSC